VFGLVALGAHLGGAHIEQLAIGGEVAGHFLLKLRQALQGAKKTRVRWPGAPRA